MTWSLTVSFTPDEFDQILEDYDCESTEDLRDEVREDMKNAILNHEGESASG